MVGDSLTADIEGAMSFGYQTCWYNPEGETCSLTRDPDYTISHFDQLRDLLMPL
ncbi:MAG: HAD hydrolase-like protein [Bacteroidota bacterium]|nr:HAD hydrolase-like protein [Bacteroidota bacterium]